VQPYSAGSTQHARTIPPFNLDSLPDLVALARHMLPTDVAIQVFALVPAGLDSLNFSLEQPKTLYKDRL
jgi:hypothetical protein